MVLIGWCFFSPFFFFNFFKKKKQLCRTLLHLGTYLAYHLQSYLQNHPTRGQSPSPSPPSLTLPSPLPSSPSMPLFAPPPLLFLLLPGSALRKPHARGNLGRRMQWMLTIHTSYLASKTRPVEAGAPGEPFSTNLPPPPDPPLDHPNPSPSATTTLYVIFLRRIADDGRCR